MQAKIDKTPACRHEGVLIIFTSRCLTKKANLLDLIDIPSTWWTYSKTTIFGHSSGPANAEHPVEVTNSKVKKGCAKHAVVWIWRSIDLQVDYLLSQASGDPETVRGVTLKIDLIWV